MLLFKKFLLENRKLSQLEAAQKRAEYSDHYKIQSLRNGTKPNPSLKQL